MIDFISSGDFVRKVYLLSSSEDGQFSGMELVVVVFPPQVFRASLSDYLRRPETTFTPILRGIFPGFIPPGTQERCRHHGKGVPEDDDSSLHQWRMSMG